LHRPPHGAFRPVQGTIDRAPQRDRTAFEDYARQTGQNNLDPAQLIDAPARPIHVPRAHADALDGTCELPGTDSQLAPDMRAILGLEIAWRGTNVRGNLRRMSAGPPLGRLG
jgi:hypothetical protein